MDKIWVKKHIINFAVNSEYNYENRNGYWSFEKLKENQHRLWKKDKDYDSKFVHDMIEHCVITKQIIVDEEGFVHLGEVMFEDAKPVSKAAGEAAREIMDNLRDRRGIKQEIYSMDEDVVEEMENNLAVIIDEHLKKRGGEAPMKIIKPGNPPEEVLYRGTCLYCKAEVEFEAKEGNFNQAPSYRNDESYYDIDCPTKGCNHKINGYKIK